MKRALPTVAILAGGLASRMRPLSESVPKAMIEVAGEPFIAHQLRLLRREGVRDVVLCLGHLGEQVQAFVGGGGRFGLAVRYSSDGARLLGTGGALRKALKLLGPYFLVLYGDSYLDVAFAPVVEAFAASGLDGLMTVYRNDGRWDASNIVFEAGRILFYSKTEKRPDMRHIDYGLGILKAEVLERYPQGEPFDLADVYAALVAAGRLAGFEVQQRFYEIGSPEGLAATEAYLRRAAESTNSSRDADGRS
ncbi:MAG TPA: nucleotidyltransferase family protein [Alphaproteobacteria bacterium]|nr:nucleotidyltransferase family protein [Alphaproteobacteria bacterium]